MDPRGGFYCQITKDHWNKVGTKIKAGIPAGLELCGFGIERVAKQDSRVDTGRYRSSIGHSTDLRTPKGIKEKVQINPDDAIWNLTKGVLGIWLYIGTNVEYAPDLERRYGTLLKAMTKCRGLLLASLKETMSGSIIL
jgi:hypothetical protein